MPEGEQRCPYHHSPEQLSCERRRPPRGIYEEKENKFSNRVAKKPVSISYVWKVGQRGFQSDTI